MTTLYLTEHEYEHLRARTCFDPPVVKHRYRWRGDAYSIDVFEASLAGLVLADLEMEDPVSCWRPGPFLIGRTSR